MFLLSKVVYFLNYMFLLNIIFVISKIIKYSKTSKDTDYIAFQIYDDMIKDKFIVE